MSDHLALRSQVFLARLLIHHPSHFENPRNVPEEKFEEHIPKVEQRVETKYVFESSSSPHQAPEPAVDFPVRLTVREIAMIVANFYGVSMFDMCSMRRTKNLVRPRQVAFYLARHYTTCSLPQIGKVLGNRDHTTVLHGVNKVTSELVDNDRLYDEIDLLKRRMVEYKPAEVAA